MPKLPCRCGYVHNLSNIPDDGYRVLSAFALDRLLSMTERQAEDWEVLDLLRTDVTSLYSCPNCEALLWERANDGYFMQYAPMTGYLRIFADLGDRDHLGNVWLRHPRTLADVQAQRVLLRPGVYVIVHDDHEEIYARLEPAVDEAGGEIPDAWVAWPLEGDELEAVAS
jgi:hypothetical protein